MCLNSHYKANAYTKGSSVKKIKTKGYKNTDVVQLPRERKKRREIATGDLLLPPREKAGMRVNLPFAFSRLRHK